MATGKYNVAALGGCPTLDEIEAAFEVWGRPADNAYGLIEVDRNGDWHLDATMCYTKSRTVKSVNNESGEMEEVSVKTTSLIQFRLTPPDEDDNGEKIGRLETFSGSHGSLGTIVSFLKQCIEQKTDGSAIEVAKPLRQGSLTIDMLDFYRKVQDKLKTHSTEALLVGAKIGSYAVEDKIYGAYTPKFVDPGEGVEFVEKNLKNVKSIKVQSRFFGEKKSTLTIAPDASFAFGGDAESFESMQWFLSELIVLPTTLKTPDEVAAEHEAALAASTEGEEATGN